MKGWEILLLIGIAVAFIAAVVLSVYGKIKHKGGCDCGGNCAGCTGCGQTQPKEESKSCPHCSAVKNSADDKNR